MSEESAVTTVEAVLLAENMAENETEIQTPVEPPAHAVAAAPASPSPEAVPLKQVPVTPAKPAPAKPAAPAAPAAPPQSVAASTDAGDAGKLDKLKRLLPHLPYLLIGLLLLMQIVTLVKLGSTSHKLAGTEQALSEMKEEFQKSQAEQDKRFAEALQDKEKRDTESHKLSVATETLNRLRAGLPEQRLMRKRAGDWYVMGAREEAIGNPEAIEVLNNAYTIAKSAERNSQTMIPPHTGNAVLVLRPDGKGGTRVTTAYDYIVERK